MRSLPQSVLPPTETPFTVPFVMVVLVGVHVADGETEEELGGATTEEELGGTTTDEEDGFTTEDELGGTTTEEELGGTTTEEELAGGFEPQVFKFELEPAKS